MSEDDRQPLADGASPVKVQGRVKTIGSPSSASDSSV